MSRELDRQRREREFHGATHALDWRRAEQLAVAALQDRDRPRPNGTPGANAATLPTVESRRG